MTAPHAPVPDTLIFECVGPDIYQRADVYRDNSHGEEKPYRLWRNGANSSSIILLKNEEAAIELAREHCSDEVESLPPPRIIELPLPFRV